MKIKVQMETQIELIKREFKIVLHTIETTMNKLQVEVVVKWVNNLIVGQDNGQRLL